jgi:hypothetical protein
LSSCRIPEMEQPEPGRFRIAYMVPEEYHLTVSATGYYDGEAFTPKVTKLQPIKGIVVKLKKKGEGAVATVAKQTISGTVTRDGKPVKTGWVGLWEMPRRWSVVNAPVLRGRTVVGEPFSIARAPIRDGAYSLNVPYPKDDWYVVAEEPGQALTQRGPVRIGVNEKKSLDIACVPGGSLRGQVTRVPSGWEGHLWVVAFTKTGIRAETRVDCEGGFFFSNLSPGKYGLKVGHNAGPK